MDSVFELDEQGRASFLQIVVQSTGCSYVCLWSCLPLASCLCSLDGFYQENGNGAQPGSSSGGTLARRLFEEYRKSLFIIHDNHNGFPGFAYRTSHPCVEVKEEDLSRLVTNHAQRQFYLEAKIKKAVYMGCRSGEIEFGFSHTSSSVDAEALLRTLFPEDFSFPRHAAVQDFPLASSSSSSWRSLSMDSRSPEYSSLLSNLPGSSSFIPDSLKDAAAAAAFDHQAVSSHAIATTSTPPPMLTIPQQLQALQAFPRIPNLQFPNIPGSEHDLMTKAFLTVISSPPSSSASPQSSRPGSAFKRFSSGLPPTAAQMKPNTRRHDSMIKRAIGYFRNLTLMRARQSVHAAGVGSRPTSTQLHHMMSERKRREKLNESLQALKSLLPPGTKRDKASVLSTTKEYLTSLRAQIDELRQRNATLEAQLAAAKETTEEPLDPATKDDPIDVRVRRTSESTSQGHRTIDLQVVIRRECSSVQLLIRVLEFLKQLNNINLTSMDADTRVADAGTVNRLNLRLRIEENEWDERAFEEAVRRVVADVEQRRQF